MKQQVGTSPQLRRYEAEIYASVGVIFTVVPLLPLPPGPGSRLWVRGGANLRISQTIDPVSDLTKAVSCPARRGLAIQARPTRAASSDATVGKLLACQPMNHGRRLSLGEGARQAPVPRRHHRAGDAGNLGDRICDAGLWS